MFRLLRQPSRAKMSGRPAPLPQIPIGDLIITGEGFEYRQEQLQSLFNRTQGEHLRFSLTPPVKHQLDHDWPKMPFVNINLPNSLETTYSNWLGYIYCSFSTPDLLSLLGRIGSCAVDGSIFVDEGLKVQLHLPIEFAVTELYTSHSHDERVILSSLYNESESSLPVQLKTVMREQKAVIGLFRDGQMIGYLSESKSKKFAEMLRSRHARILSARLGMRAFSPNDRQPYSKIAITTISEELFQKLVQPSALLI